MNIHDEKQTLRRMIRGELASMSESERNDASALIVDHIARHELFLRCKTLCAFIALPSEVDVLPLIDLALSLGKQVAIPRCRDDGSLDFHVIEHEFRAHVVAGPFSVKEPSGDAPLLSSVDAHTLILVPGLAFSRSGARLGKGKGYYDRYLCTVKNHVHTVGVCFERQIVSHIPRGDHDIMVTSIVTESGWITH